MNSPTQSSGEGATGPANLCPPLPLGRPCYSAGQLVLSATELCKNYPGVKAMDGVSLELRRGEVVCLIGPNGAGKTTLLYLLAGLTYPSSGDVHVLGMHRWRDNHAIRLRSTILPATPVTGASPTPYEYLRYMAQVYGLSKDLFMLRLEELCRQMNYLPYLSWQWEALSLGLQKKAGLIGSFLPDAELRILDEPFAGGIDPMGMEVLYNWFEDSRVRGETIVFSTQVLEQAEQASDRIAVINEGRIAVEGPPEELLARAGISGSEPRALARAFVKLMDKKG